MNKIFWYGSVLAPLIGSMVGLVIGLFGMYLWSFGPSEVVTLSALNIPIFLWFLIANVMALYHVATDPENDRKALWIFGWFFANAIMHAVFVWVYVYNGKDRR